MRSCDFTVILLSVWKKKKKEKNKQTQKKKKPKTNKPVGERANPALEAKVSSSHNEGIALTQHKILRF